jgi:uncharacterized protein
MTQNLYAYNVTRQAFISLGVTLADAPWSRLRGLFGRIKLRSDEGLWVVPSRGVHLAGSLFATDSIYLDENSRVVHLAEHPRSQGFRLLRRKCASVLQVPVRAIEASGTRAGDLILIRSPREIFDFCAAQQAPLDCNCRMKASGR